MDLDKLVFQGLQLFAGPKIQGQEVEGEESEDEEDLVTPDEEEEDTEDDDESEGDESKDGEAGPRGQKKGDQDTEGQDASKTGGKKGEQQPKGDRLFTQEEVDTIVQRRLARAEKPATNFSEVISERGGIPPLPDTEIVDASRLWTYLKANPQINAQVKKLVDEGPDNMPTYTRVGRRSGASPAEGGADPEARMERHGLLVELRVSDPTFKKYEKQIMTYAEANEIDTSSARGIRIAYKAWRGEKAHLLEANAELRGQQKARDQREAVDQARGVPRKGNKPGKAKDYRNMKDEDVLADMGLKLFDDEE